MRKTTLIIGSILLVTSTASANYEVDRLMDSYLIAKAETFTSPISEEEAQKTPYTIQVASYVNEKDAASHVEELRVQEKDVFYYPAFVRGTVWFKVCVGKFTKRDEAETYRKKFVKRMDEPFSVVISLLDRPTSRNTASVAQKEPVAVPVGKSDTVTMNAPKAGNAKDTPSVQLMKKAVANAQPEKMIPMGVPTASTKAASVTTTTTTTTTPVATTTAAESTTATTTSAAAGDFYSVQVGAYASERLAKEKLTTLTQDSTETFVQEAQVDGKTLYRAFVGKFGTHNEAKTYQQALSEKTPKLDSFIRKMK